MVGVLVASRGAVVAAVVAVALVFFLIEVSYGFCWGAIIEIGTVGLQCAVLQLHCCCVVDAYLGVGAAAGDGVAAVAVGGLGRHFLLWYWRVWLWSWLLSGVSEM